MYKYLLLLLTPLFLISCSDIEGVYVNMQFERDTIILMDNGEYKRKVNEGYDSSFIYVGEYYIQGKHITFKDWKNTSTDEIVFTGMTIEHSLFSSGATKLRYSELQIGCYKQISK